MQKYIYTVIVLTMVIGSTYAKRLNLEDIKIVAKKNGVILELKVDSIPKMNNITAWQANSGWFYITMYEFQGDTALLRPAIIPDEIKKFQIIDTDQSIQLGLKLFNNITHYDFLPIYEKETIYTTLHYSNDILSNVISKKNLGKPLYVRKKPNGIKKWLYLTGTAFTVTGLINENINSRVNNQTLLGISILLGTFIYDNIWID